MECMLLMAMSNSCIHQYWVDNYPRDIAPLNDGFENMLFIRADDIVILFTNVVNGRLHRS